MLKSANSIAEKFQGKKFPCPVCGLALPVQLSVKQKPYCVCYPCGIQLFFRGKNGITRLLRMLESGPQVLSGDSKADLAVRLFARLQALKNQRDQLKEKQGLFRVDRDLQNAISVIEVEIGGIQEELRKLAPAIKREKSK